MDSATALNPYIDLEKLARERFGQLSIAESKIMRAVSNGEEAQCGPSGQDGDSLNDPACADNWSVERHVRAELIRWLCVDRDAKSHIDPKGIRIHGARITHSLDISFVEINFPLRFICCRLTDHFDMTGSELALLELTGSWLRSLCMANARVKGSILMKNNFFAMGKVSLPGARIEGDLDCSKGKFQNLTETDDYGRAIALNAQRAKVSGNILFCSNFSAEGEVSLYAVEVGGNLDCSDGKLKHLAKPGFEWSGIALNATAAKIGGAVRLTNHFSAQGAVWLLRAQIGGNLECGGGGFCVESEAATIVNTADAMGQIPRPSVALGPAKLALSADSARVEGHVFLGGTFRAELGVHLYQMEIGGTLNCDGARFENPALSNTAEQALNASLVKVAGDVLLGNMSSSNGQILFSGAQIEGAFEYTNAVVHHLDLTGASTSSIRDAAGNWPATLILDGFIYQCISSGPADAHSRIEWLSRQTPFKRQPYRQLSQVLRNAGDEKGWRVISIEMERRARQRHGQSAPLMGATDNRSVKNLLSWMLRSTIGYGYSSLRIVPWFLMLIMLGSILYRCAYEAGAIVPNQEKPYSVFQANCNAPEYYESFHALAYSFENSFPLVKLGIQDRWGPAPIAQITACTSGKPVPGVLFRIISPGLVRWFRWCQILIGWGLTTLFVAGLTGIVRRD